jgi:4-hydroxy-tetrahydrodipicolinate synthase
MAGAREAREWAAQGGLHGLGESLYTPFAGPAGDDIDYDAWRALVRYCVRDLRREMLWLTSGNGEWWSLTSDERKKMLEIAVDEARGINPATVIQACTAAASPKDCLELTQHAQSVGADIVYIQTPPMEVHGGEGVLRFFQYIADRTDIALGLFNTPSAGYVLTVDDMVAIYDAIPAVCAVKEGVQDSYAASPALHARAPQMQVWECDLLVYRAGWLQQGIVTPAQLGGAGYLWESPENPRYRTYWELIWAGDIPAAIAHATESGLDAMMGALSSFLTNYPGRPDYFTHWGAAFRHAASLLGLPVGDYPESRPPQGILPERAKQQIRAAVEQYGTRPAVLSG